MYQAYVSLKPFSNEKLWLRYTGKTIEEVRKQIRENETDWSDIYVAEVDEKMKVPER